jgi:RNA polymerase sigma-70 factor, ECF subfamily
MSAPLRLSPQPARDESELDVGTGAGAGAGGRAEFEALYREQFAFVWRTLRRFGVAESALEDVAQEVFLVAFRRAGAWAEWSSPRAWLFGVARRVAADHRRSRDRHARKLAALPELAAPQPIDERVDDHVRLNAVAAAIAQLSPDRRAVYTLAELEGMSAPEIAEALELKLNTVYSKLRRARHDVATSLAAAGFALAHTPGPEHTP